MTKFILDRFRLEIPDEYEVHKKEHWQFGISYKIYLGDFGLAFKEIVTNRIPECLEEYPKTLEEYIGCMTNQRVVTIEDVNCNGIRGEKYGVYSEGRSDIEWWLKVGNSMLILRFTGDGMPSDKIKQQVSQILNTLTYVRTDPEN